MALSLENINLVKQRSRWQTLKKPAQTEALRALWIHMEQKGNPDLQLVTFDQTGNADTVIADAACKLYAVVFNKPATSTTAAWLKISDHATTAAAAGDLVIPLAAAAAAIKNGAIVCPDGLDMANGVTMASHTAVNGNTDSNDADAAAGFVIIGAA
jgi:hypothetical protein